MEFSLVLRPGVKFSILASSKYDEELDDIRSILDDLCKTLKDSTPSEFIVSGFGQDRWPVDVGTDLSVFLEQLPDAIAAVKSMSSFSIDFYEQGIERTIHFDLKENTYTAHCESQTNWIPNPCEEKIRPEVLVRMLCDIRDGIVSHLETFAPQISSHPWVTEFFSEKSHA